jgi:hypothetical protein
MILEQTLESLEPGLMICRIAAADARVTLLVAALLPRVKGLRESRALAMIGSNRNVLHLGLRPTISSKP